MFAIKRKLKLNNKQQTFMSECAGYSRFVYNYALSIITDYRKNGGKGGDSKIINEIKKIFTNYTKKRYKFRWCNDYSSKIYQKAFEDLKRAFTNYREQRAEYPKFKRRKDKKSFTVYEGNGKTMVVSGNKIKIPTLGTFRLHEPLTCSYVTQTFTITQEGDGWYVSFTVDVERVPVSQHEFVEPLGIDLGISAFATTSSDDPSDIEFMAPNPYRRAKTKLRNLQWRNKNKVLGSRWIKDAMTGKRRKIYIKPSNNAKKYYRKLAKQHKQIADRRKDFLHKTTSHLSKKYAVHRLEDLNVKGMMANGKLSTAIADQGFYEFRRQLTYKANWNGGRVELVDRWFPSTKQCIECENKQDMPLHKRIFECSNCGFTMPRDRKAALSLSTAPLEYVRLAQPESDVFHYY